MEFLYQYWAVIISLIGAIVYIIRLEGKVKVMIRERANCQKQCDDKLQSMKLDSNQDLGELKKQIKDVADTVGRIDRCMVSLVSFLEGKGMQLPRQ